MKVSQRSDSKLMTTTLTWYPAAFEGFLEAFKTSSTTSAIDALNEMNIDDDDFSDEYDFAESDEEAQEARRAARKESSRPKLKYMELLQRIANREEDEITIELDDLAEVCAIIRVEKFANLQWSVREGTSERRHQSPFS
jgi:MCM N-terminal domain